MADIRVVTPNFAVAPQIDLGDVAAAADAGYRLLINNRPDGEAPGQPTSEQVREAAAAAGVEYLYIPVVGGPTREQIQSMRQAIAAAPGPVLAFCRSGTRSITTWAIGEVAIGGGDPAAVLRDAAGAGYDLRATIG